MTLGRLRTGMAESAYLTPEVKTALMEQLMQVRALERSRGKTIPFMFLSPRNRLKAGPWKNIKNAWREACRRAGCPRMLQHDLTAHRCAQHAEPWPI